jgi:hypothetical protein
MNSPRAPQTVATRAGAWGDYSAALPVRQIKNRNSSEEGNGISEQRSGSSEAVRANYRVAAAAKRHERPHQWQ